MYCIGLTGSIGSGKTTVANLFAQQGVEIVNADQIAKQLTLPEEPAFIEIVSHFGQMVLDSNGQINRPWLREKIMQNPLERQWLEQLLHPMIRNKIVETIQKPPQIYYMIEIPLLTHKRDYSYLNRVLLVLSQPQLQIKRIMQRDSNLSEQAELILKSQADEKMYRSVADDIIINNSSIEDLENIVFNLHRIYLKKRDSRYK